jgi:hypothetical protein
MRTFLETANSDGGRTRGTRNAGISSDGRLAIGAVLISPAVPEASKQLTVPMVIADEERIIQQA